MITILLNLSLVSLVFSACNVVPESKIAVTTLAAAQDQGTLDSSLPPVAKPDEIITVTGENLIPGRAYFAKFKLADGSEKKVRLTVVDTRTATFAVPSGLGLGQKDFDVVIGDRTINTFSLVADDASNTLSIFTGDASDICSTKTYIDKTGATKTGTKDCATGSVSDCTGDGIVGCKTVTAFPSASAALANSGNIKSGVTIAGVTGAYPSSTYPLPNASGTADLDAATFNAKVKSATAFEYWDASGARQTGAGDADITAANIVSSVDIFGTSGSASASSPNAWDVRAGVTVGSTTGKLQVNCRNGATLGTFDQAEYPKSATVDNTTEFVTITAHGWSDNQTVRVYYSGTPSPLGYFSTYYVRNSTPNTFQLALTNGGAPIDITANGSSVFVYKWGDAVTQIWDTIDDSIGYASSTPTYTGWSAANNTCGGIESVADDANVWKDVTTTGDGVTASTCTATAAHCSMKDKISGLEWHKPDTTGRGWATALSYCDNLSYNGKTDWRLPTQKELMATYTDGIMSTANATNWITSVNLQENYWSSSSYPTPNMSNAWYVSPANGSTYYVSKYITLRVICVRP